MSDDNGEILEQLGEIKKILFLIFCQQKQIRDSLHSPGEPPTSLKDAMADAAAFLRGMKDPY
jgi:hypothetical protein